MTSQPWVCKSTGSSISYLHTSSRLCQSCMVYVLNPFCSLQVLQSNSEAMTAKKLAQAAIN